MNAIAYISDGDDDDPDPEEINLGSQYSGEDPTSLNSTHISAFKVGTSISIHIDNFFGNVDASVLGISGHITSNQNPITGSGVIFLNISSLPSGTYSLLIFAERTYQGDFTI